MVEMVRPPGPSPQSPQRRKLYLMADETFGKDEQGRQERMELTRYLLRRDITSWRELSDEQVLRLLDAFEGHHLIQTLLDQRPPPGALITEEDGHDVGTQVLSGEVVE